MNNRTKTRVTHVLFSTSLFVVLVVLWHIVTITGMIKPFFLPQPIQVLRAAVELFTVHAFIKDVLMSVFRITTGFTIAAILAIPVGIAIGLSKKSRAIIEPLIDFIRYTPIPAFIPLFVLWFGIGELEKIIVIVAAVFFQLVLMVANSISQVPHDIVDFARTLGTSTPMLISKVMYKYAQPRIFDDLRVSMGWAWAGLMIAEVVGATSGIGFVIVQSQRLLRTANVIAAIIFVGLIGLATDYAFKRAHHALFPWKYGK